MQRSPSLFIQGGRLVLAAPLNRPKRRLVAGAHLHKSDIRLETRTPDMDGDESKPLKNSWIRIGDNVGLRIWGQRA